MLQTLKQLRLQAALLILVSCSTLTGLVSLAVDLVPELAVPERLMLTTQGALAIILAGSVILALTARNAMWRILPGVFLALAGGYGLVHWTVISILGWEFLSHALPGALALAPSLLVLMMAVVSFLGVRSKQGVCLGMAAGVLGALAGATILVAHFLEGGGSDTDGFVAGFSATAGVYCLSFGISIFALARQGASIHLSWSREALLTGIASIVSSFALFLLVSWTVHTERSEEANIIVQHSAQILMQDLEGHVKQVERFVGRWDAPDSGDFLAPLRTDVHRYFTDLPALDALLIVRGNGHPPWRSARSREDLLWLTDQIEKPLFRSWLGKAQRFETGNRWFIPDGTRPFKVFCLVASSRSQGQLVAVFDVRTLLSYEAPHSDHEFHTGLLVDPYSRGLAKEMAGPRGSPEIFEVAEVELASEPRIFLSASAGPPPPFSIDGILPVAVLIFGLGASYLVIMGRSLLVAYRFRTQELDRAEQEFRSLFWQSPDAIFAFDKNGSLPFRVESVAS